MSEPINGKKLLAIHNEVQRQLGSGYAWEGELYYRGHPITWRATQHEEFIVKQAIEKAEGKEAV